MARFISIVFSIIFLMVYASTAQALEAAPSCVGTNLFTKLKADNPIAFEAVEKEIKQSHMAGTNFWKIEKQGVKPSYLFGTMHSTDQRIQLAQHSVKTILEQVDHLAVEVADVDPQKAQNLFRSQPELLIAKDGEKASQILTPQELKELQTTMQAAGMPPTMADMFRPWYLNIALFAVPSCEKMRMAAGLKVLDQQIINRAKSRKINVVSLETLKEQFSSMAALPLDVQTVMLKDSLAMKELRTDLYTTMVSFYSSGNINAVVPLSFAYAPDPAASRKAWKSFKTILLDKRNETMATRSLPLLEKGNALIAVGALHINGEKGIVTLLRKKGFKLTPMPSTAK